MSDGMLKSNPNIYEFEPKIVVGVGSIGEPISPGDVWPKLFERIDEIPFRKHAVETLGIIKRNEHGYIAGVEVKQIIDLPEGLTSYEVPAGKYVGMTHKGPLSKINETFETLVVWLSENHHEQYDIVCFEVYDDRFKVEDPESEFDMYLQIK